MSTVHSPLASGLSATRPTVDELVGRATALQPVLKAAARETEANRRVSSEVIAALAANELLGICKPARFGGLEYGPSAMVRIGFELGRACGSTAWCAMLASCNGWFASYWSLQAQEDLWGDNPGNLLAAPLAPTGKCEPVDGGYRVWGRWPYASNCDNSDWSVVSAIVPPNGDAPAGAAWFLTPMSSLNIDQDTWHMAGMQGTGSKTLYVDEPIFIPSHRMVRLSDVLALTTPGASLEGNVMAGFGWSTFGASALVGPILGMAQGALDWFVENMRSKIRPGATSSVADGLFAQERAGRASAAIDAAMALIVGDLQAAELAVFSGGQVDVGQRVKIRRDFGFGVRQAVDAVNDLLAGAGASSAELDRPLQRFWRDVNAAAGHVSLDDQAIMAVAGQQLFGLEPKGAY